ncbi:DNA-binding response regulator [Malaciobacter molluscorum LMG 25693]|uniref:DNA-binding response regulator n=1 Tax=Malaciobacter molluscorum LMG 25693 TaxID=870501 RepID=A0A2G1DLG5_9BACT|nr:response regulator transcription factor [Malaciobacter molluscorum]AXX92001.1 two-component system response regulator [Malaciobacter molluscorum LMG 25693]PHO19234.1 DNA-binding response regulator [Malaciobacter molluscorum LMG 25693]RXJ96502.1 DNA-binding response regulator [Malaciobacter molluscorum]
MKELIHIIEDDSSVRKLLEETFKEYDFNFISSESKKNAMVMYLSHNPNLLIVDLGLPDGDGKEFIRNIREISKVPIIVLTARDDEKEIISTLDAGADDYITKPFSVKELLARIRANLRRNIQNENISDIYNCGELQLNISTRDISLKDEILKLTPIEYDLLKYFILNANKTLTHKQTLNEVWGTGYQNEMQYLRTYVNILRKKIEEDSTRPKYIKTISGVGYRFCSNKED